MSDDKARTGATTALHITLHQHRASLVKLATEARRLQLGAAKRDIQTAVAHLESAITNLAADPPDQGEQLPLPQLDSDTPPSR